MVRRKNNVPLDYSLCSMTVTVYHGARRQVLRGVHFEFTQAVQFGLGEENAKPSFLLVIPGGADIAPGDRVLLGEGPESCGVIPDTQTLCVVSSVKPRYFRGRLCHTEARGE